MYFGLFIAKLTMYPPEDDNFCDRCLEPHVLRTHSIGAVPSVLFHYTAEYANDSTIKMLL